MICYMDCKPDAKVQFFYQEEEFHRCTFSIAEKAMYYIGYKCFTVIIKNLRGVQKQKKLFREGKKRVVEHNLT